MHRNMKLAVGSIVLVAMASAAGCRNESTYDIDTFATGSAGGTVGDTTGMGGATGTLLDTGYVGGRGLDPGSNMGTVPLDTGIFGTTPPPSSQE